MSVPPKAASDFVYRYGIVANAAWLRNLGAKIQQCSDAYMGWLPAHIHSNILMPICHTTDVG